MADFTITGNTKLDTSGITTGLGKISKAATTGLKVAGVAFGVITTGLGAISANALKYNAQMEQYQTSFETMLGSEEKAVSLMADLKKKAADTPFEMKDLASTTQLLLNYGFTADEVVGKMTMLGDISQGNSDKLKSVATAYGQMSSAGKVSLEDVKQMIEAGFNPLQEISESTGESMSSLYDRISKGTISVDEITASMERSTSAGGKYFQSMEKQSKTVSGQLSTLGDNFNEFTGKIYTGLSTQLRDEILPLGISYIEQMSDAYEKEGMTGLTSATGNIIAELVTKFASAAPSLIKTSALIIKSFCSGLWENRSQLKNAAKDILKALADGIISLLPSQLQRPVSVAFSKLGKMFETLVDAAIKVAKVMLPPLVNIFSVLAENIDVVGPIIAGVVLALKGFSIVNGITTSIVGLTKMFGVFTTAMMSNPLGLAVAAIAALIGVVIGLRNALSDSVGQSLKENDAFNESMKQSAEAVKQSVEARKQAIEDTNVEFDHTQSLRDELQTIVDANGQIKQGYEERAAFITSELSGALGQEITIVDGVIQNYGNLKGTIDQVIQAKRADALLTAYQDDYTEAIKKQKSAEDDLLTAKKNTASAQKEYNDVVAEHGDNSKFFNLAVYNQKTKLEEVKEAENNAKTALEEYNGTISTYEEASGIIVSGSGRSREAIVKLTNGFKTATKENAAEMLEQYNNARTRLEEIRQAFAEGGQGITEQQVSDAELMQALATQEWATFGTVSESELIAAQEIINAAIDTSGTPEAAQQEGSEVSQSYAEGVEGSTPVAVEAAETQQQQVEDSYAGADTTNAYDSGAAQAEAVAEGATNATPEAEAAVTSMVQATGDAAGAADVSAQTTAAATSIVNTFAQTLGTGGSVIQAATTGLGTAAAAGFRSSMSGASFTGTINAATYNMLAAINGKTGSMQTAGSGLGKAVVNGVKGVNIGSGIALMATVAMTLFISAITSKQSAASNAGRNIANAVKIGVTGAGLSAAVQMVGGIAASAFVGSIAAKNGTASSAGRNLANSAQRGLASAGISGYGTGANFAIGFANGISSNAFRAAVQARAMANAAAAAANAALQIRSPSRVGGKTGMYYVMGVANAMLKYSKLTEAAAVDMTKSVVDNVNLDSALSPNIEMPIASIGNMNLAAAYAGSGQVINNQYVTFEETMQAPSEVARALRRQQQYGLAGG